jgi:hypothetical protein
LKKNTLKLIAATSVLYFAVLFLSRGFLPPDITPPLYLLVGPLLLVLLVLVSDLSVRATSPSESAIRKPPSRTLAREVKLLTRQIDVATQASSAYFESILLSRLRDVLVNKVSLETGLEREGVLDLLGNYRLGVGLLRDERLYRLLYSKPGARGAARVKMLDEAVERIEAWKP